VGKLWKNEVIMVEFREERQGIASPANRDHLKGTDGLRDQVILLEKLSERLDEYFALR
jgi:hypothetical protein